MRNILLPENLLTPRQRAPLNFSSGWVYLKKYEEGKKDGEKVDYINQQQRAWVPN